MYRLVANPLFIVPLSYLQTTAILVNDNEGKSNQKTCTKNWRVKINERKSIDVNFNIHVERINTCQTIKNTSISNNTPTYLWMWSFKVWNIDIKYRKIFCLLFSCQYRINFFYTNKY